MPPKAILILLAFRIAAICQMVVTLASGLTSSLSLQPAVGSPPDRTCQMVLIVHHLLQTPDLLCIHCIEVGSLFDLARQPRRSQIGTHEAEDALKRLYKSPLS